MLHVICYILDAIHYNLYIIYYRLCIHLPSAYPPPCPFRQLDKSRTAVKNLTGWQLAGTYNAGGPSAWVGWHFGRTALDGDCASHEENASFARSWECLCEQSFCWWALMTLMTTLKNRKFWPVLAISRARQTRKQRPENILRNRRKIVKNHPEIVKKGGQKHQKGGPRAAWAPPGTLLGALGAPNGILVRKPWFVGRPWAPHGRPVWAHFRSKKHKKRGKRSSKKAP